GLPDHRHRDGVRLGERPQLGERFGLRRRRRQVVEAGGDAVVGQRVEDAGGQRLGGEFVEGVDADGGEQRGDGGGVRADVAVDEGELGGGGLIRHEGRLPTFGREERTLSG